MQKIIKKVKALGQQTIFKSSINLNNLTEKKKQSEVLKKSNLLKTQANVNS